MNRECVVLKKCEESIFKGQPKMEATNKVRERDLKPKSGMTLSVFQENIDKKIKKQNEMKYQKHLTNINQQIETFLKEKSQYGIGYKNAVLCRYEKCTNKNCRYVHDKKDLKDPLCILSLNKTCTVKNCQYRSADETRAVYYKRLPPQ